MKNSFLLIKKVEKYSFHIVSTVILSCSLASALYAQPNLKRDISELAGEHGECADPLTPLQNISPELLSSQSHSQVTAPVVNTLHQAAVPENAINIVIMGDGFTQSQISTFNERAQQVTNHLFALEPFRSFSDHFNVYAVEVISNQSGVDYDYNYNVDTALDMGFYCAGTSSTFRLLCLGSNAYQDYLNFVPGVENNFFLIVLGNSTTYGGAGGGYLATASLHSDMPEIVAHELGHTNLAQNLSDEYQKYSGSNPYCGNTEYGDYYAANVSRYSYSEIVERQSKWYQWLDESPSLLFGEGFGPKITHPEGAAYATCNYRPSHSSKMRSLWQPFNIVHIQSFIKGMYDYVDLIDASTPSGLRNARLPLTVSPKIDDVSVSWYVNDEIIIGATATSLIPSQALNILPGQSYNIRVKVRLNSPLVRLN